jgi:hypothetical protein
MRKTTKSRNPPDNIPEFKDGREFDALSAADKEKVWNYYNRKIPKSELRDPTPREKAALRVHRGRMEKMKKKMGRPRIGQGAKMVAVTLEKGLLERVDAYAKRHGLKRAQMIVTGLLTVMGEGRTN